MIRFNWRCWVGLHYPESTPPQLVEVVLHRLDGSTERVHRFTTERKCVQCGEHLGRDLWRVEGL